MCTMLIFITLLKERISKSGVTAPIGKLMWKKQIHLRHHQDVKPILRND